MVLSAIIFGLCAVIMITIGFLQYKSKTPVTFYTGENPYKSEEITDVKAWNRKHGLMWITYGIIIIISWFIGYLLSDSLWMLLPFILGFFVPIFVMIGYHEYLVNKYKK